MIAELSTLGAMATLHRVLIEGLLNMMNRLLLWSVKTKILRQMMHLNKTIIKLCHEIH